MSGEEKTETTPEPKVKETAPKPREGYTPKKATPTPLYKRVNAANKQPTVTNRRVMSREEHGELRREWLEVSTARRNRQQEAMRMGDERNMPPQYAGLVHRFGYGVIDSRFSPGSYFMPLALLLLARLFIQRFAPRLFVVFTVSAYAIFIVIAVWAGKNVRHTWVLTKHRFDTDRISRGFSMRLFSRAFYPRRWYVPHPQVTPGNIPAGTGDVDYKEAKAEREKD